MISIEVHAGDFKVGKGALHLYVEKVFSEDYLAMKKEGVFFREKIPLSSIASIDVASEENVKKMAGTVGWGLAGGLVFGPLGLLAGLIAGGRSKDVTFVCMLKDGRKFMATTNNKAFTKMKAATFK
jgi:hypothetical protein